MKFRNKYRKEPTLSNKKVIEAFNETGGDFKETAKKLDCSHRTVWYRLENNAYLRKKLSQINNGRVDIAEEKLFEKVQEGNLSAIIFFLKCQGKERGYVEREERVSFNATDFKSEAVSQLNEWLREMLQRREDSQDSDVDTERPLLFAPIRPKEDGC